MSSPPDLHKAAHDGDLAGVRRCLAAGVSVDSVDEEKCTALYWSSAKGHLSIVDYLVENGADIEKEIENLKRTALYIASSFGHLPVVSLLVEKGADLEHKSSTGYTPVHTAAERGHLPVVKYLAEKGANLDARTPRGHNATHKAAQSGHLNIMKYLEERGCDMNAKTNEGNSPYHLAAQCGQIATMQYLDSLGVSREVLNDKKQTPIMGAAAGGQLAAVKHLVLQRAKTDGVDSEGWSLVHFAVQGGSIDVLKYVEEIGLDMFARTKWGHTGYHMAAKYGHVHIMKHYEKLAVDVNSAANDGATSLIIAAIFAKIQIIEHLLNFGADVNVVIDFGKSALHYVCESSHYSSGTDQLTAAQLLVKHGARVDGRDKARMTPADYVKENEKLKVFLQESATRSQHESDATNAKPAASADMTEMTERVQCTQSRGGIGKKLKNFFKGGGQPGASASSSADNVTERVQCLDLDHEVELYAPDHPNIRCAVDRICCQFVKSLELSVDLFEPASDMCFCATCHHARGDADSYPRGQPPQKYALPIGWTRFGLKLPPRAGQLGVLPKWHRAYHGTKADQIKGILSTDLLAPPGSTVMGGKKIKELPGHFDDDWKPAGFDTKKVFLSPSPNYALHYAPTTTFQATNNKTYKVRVALAVLVNPHSYEVGPETMGFQRDGKICDERFTNNQLEWATNELGALMFSGLLVKIE